MPEWTLIGILAVEFAINSSNSNIAPFLPRLASHKGLSSWDTGLIISSTPLAACLCLPIYGTLMAKLGRKKILLACIGFEVLNIAILSTLPKYDAASFIIIGIIIRCIEGFSSAGISATSLGILTNTYKDKISQVIGMQQGVVGISLILGPIIGSLLYRIGEFTAIFVIYSVFLLLMIPVILWTVPKDSPYENPPIPVSWKAILAMRTTLMDFISIFISYLAYSSIDPILSNFITSNFSISDANVGFFFCITTSFFTVSILILSRFKGILKYKILILFNLFILSFSLFTIGPISILYIPPNFVNLVLSLALIGVGLAFGMVSFLPDMAADAFVKAPYLEKSHVLDKLSALLALGVWSGRAAGPPISGYLRDRMEFQDSEAIVGFIVFIYMIVYGVYGGGFQVIRNAKRRSKRIEEILVESEMIEAKRSFYYLDEEEQF